MKKWLCLFSAFSAVTQRLSRKGNVLWTICESPVIFSCFGLWSLGSCKKLIGYKKTLPSTKLMYHTCKKEDHLQKCLGFWDMWVLPGIFFKLEIAISGLCFLSCSFQLPMPEDKHTLCRCTCEIPLTIRHVQHMIWHIPCLPTKDS